MSPAWDKIASFARRPAFASIAVATVIFATVGSVSAAMLGAPPLQAGLTAMFAGLGVGFFEQLYVQRPWGRGLRGMHPLGSIAIYTAVVCLLLLVGSVLSHLVLGTIRQMPADFDRLLHAVPVAIGGALAGILAMRVIGFLGADTLFYLLTGKYYRPAFEDRIFVFLDMRDSTAIAERLGALRAMQLIRKFLFDLSNPITDNGGRIYLYVGDGLIATWYWSGGKTPARVFRAIDAVFAVIAREADAYRGRFGLVPEFRIGVHGGRVVVAEEGDTKRAIGVFGDPINVAARMEQVAKERGLACVVSADVAGEHAERDPRFHALPPASVRGVKEPVQVYEYRP